MLFPDENKKINFKNLLWRCLLVLIGAIIYAFAVTSFYVPANLMTGGLTGISLILNRLAGLPVGVMMIALNTPLFLLGFKKMGREFFVLSIVGVIFSSLFVDVFALFIPQIPALHGDRLLSAAVGGAVAGAGLGLTMAAGGSTGGTDIMGLLFSKKLEHLSLGRIIMFVDLIIIVAGVAIFRDIGAGLYTAVAMYLATAVIDSVLYGANIAIVMTIITKKPEPVTHAITQDLKRGVTILNGEGGYTGVPQNVLICAVGKRQLSQLKRIVRLADPGAFVIVNEAKEVMGHGFKPIE